jgi:hypothetical protein
VAIYILPLLRKTAAAKPEAPPHLTFVNSVGHEEAQKDWYSGTTLLQRANDQSRYDNRTQYVIVKLLGMAVRIHIAQATTASNDEPTIIVNACCPFVTKTDLGRNFSPLVKIPMAAFQAFCARTAE